MNSALPSGALLASLPLPGACHLSPNPVLLPTGLWLEQLREDLHRDCGRPEVQVEKEADTGVTPLHISWKGEVTLPLSPFQTNSYRKNDPYFLSSWERLDHDRARQTILDLGGRGGAWGITIEARTLLLSSYPESLFPRELSTNWNYSILYVVFSGSASPTGMYTAQGPEELQLVCSPRAPPCLEYGRHTKGPQ